MKYRFTLAFIFFFSVAEGEQPSGRVEGLDEAVVAAYPELHDSSQAAAYVRAENVEVLGWSTTGTVAALVTIDTGESGERRTRLEVIDREGKVSESASSLDTDTVATRRRIDDAIERAGIKRHGPSALERFPLPLNGEVLTPVIAAQRIGGRVRHATVMVRSSRHGTKGVRSYRFAPADRLFEAPLDVRVLGYVKNPDGPEIVVISLAAAPDWEGPPPHVGRVLLGVVDTSPLTE